MTDKIDLVFDLGPGDGGKGGVVHKLANHYKSHTVLKVGGAQGSHGVTTKNGHFAFSQWGCGTMEDIPTHITDLMVVSPDALLAEADALVYFGVINPFDMLTIDEMALCSTPFHGITSRILEMTRKDKPRGTIGSGVGQAYRRQMTHPELAIRAGDLKNNLLDKLILIRNAELEICKNAIEFNGYLSSDASEIEESMGLLSNDLFIYDVASSFKMAGLMANVVDHDFLLNDIFNRGNRAIIECSHGVLTDFEYGFVPHVSALKTLPSVIIDHFTEYGYKGEWNKVGVHRSYSIRHGAGPLPTYDNKMTRNLLPNSYKESNRYQGDVRVGPLDFVLLKYAIDVVGYDNIDSLALTWFDQVIENGVFSYCDEYADYDPDYFVDGSRINAVKYDFHRRVGLTNSLFNVKPIIETIKLPKNTEDKLGECFSIVKEKLDLNVNFVSLGPLLSDKKVIYV